VPFCGKLLSGNLLLLSGKRSAVLSGKLLSGLLLLLLPGLLLLLPGLLLLTGGLTLRLLHDRLCCRLCPSWQMLLLLLQEEVTAALAALLLAESAGCWTILTVLLRLPKKGWVQGCCATGVLYVKGLIHQQLRRYCYDNVALLSSAAAAVAVADIGSSAA
jgi:hypothetical protein